eukprot:863848-Prymnesium_polylepis.1
MLESYTFKSKREPGPSNHDRCQQCWRTQPNDGKGPTQHPQPKAKRKRKPSAHSAHTSHTDSGIYQQTQCPAGRTAHVGPRESLAREGTGPASGLNPV